MDVSTNVVRVRVLCVVPVLAGAFHHWLHLHFCAA